VTETTDLATPEELIELLKSIETIIDTLRAVAAHTTAAFIGAYAAQLEKDVSGATSH
jgi:hypothetical protein